MLREKWRKRNQKGASEDKQSPLTGFLEVRVRDPGGAQLGTGLNCAGARGEQTKRGEQGMCKLW